MEEQVIREVVELEEDIIPSEDTQHNDGGLGDVVPCEYVAIEQQEGTSSDMAGTASDGLYDDVGYTVPSGSTEEMVDIVSHNVNNSANELEEEAIPNEYNPIDDGQLNDVV